MHIKDKFMIRGFLSRRHSSPAPSPLVNRRENFRIILRFFETAHLPLP